jgi:hypothetical protein
VAANSPFAATTVQALCVPTVVGAELAKDVIEKWLPAMDQRWRVG